MYSAKPPSLYCANRAPPAGPKQVMPITAYCAQYCSVPAWQYRQLPQPIEGSTNTRWPSCTPATAEPVAATTPTGSCPIVSGR
jgi:hypothetical protein